MAQDNASPSITDIPGVRVLVQREAAVEFVAKHGEPDPSTLPEPYRQPRPAAGPGSGIPACPPAMQDSTGTWCLIDETKTECIYEQCGS